MLPYESDLKPTASMPQLPGDPFHMEAVFDTQNHQVVAVSSNSLSITGYDLSFLVGRRAIDLMRLLPAADQPVVEAIVAQVRIFHEHLPPASKISVQFNLDFRYQIKQQPYKWFKLICKPMLDAVGFITGYKADLFDVSADKTDNRITASASYLDPTGKVCYKRFTHEKRRFDELTLRERKILRLLADGLTSKEIAHLINLSKDTVDKARKVMLAKTGAKNTVELVKRYNDDLLS